MLVKSIWQRKLYIVLGWLSLLLGFIGALLPIIPTTPFAILAGYLFSKSSRKFHSRLIIFPRIGPIIQAWEAYGVIQKKIKIIATGAITLLFSYTLIFVPVNQFIKGFLVLIALFGLDLQNLFERNTKTYSWS